MFCVPHVSIKATVHESSKVEPLSCGNEGSVTTACPGPLPLQGSGGALTKRRRAGGPSSFTHLINPTPC
ncbi:hypothetical protein EYF80_020094 [Liparis tanakae]|uniref:Uncharacterized protein n=1 Tax=Liparis tanakae TaxID=230148 RepID=A0A4Z2HVV1_9TELE|nr:hypothetical protein EYF80_020094 [Liparis tanakae]